MTPVRRAAHRRRASRAFPNARTNTSHPDPLPPHPAPHILTHARNASICCCWCDRCDSGGIIRVRRHVHYSLSKSRAQKHPKNTMGIDSNNSAGRTLTEGTLRGTQRHTRTITSGRTRAKRKRDAQGGVNRWRMANGVLVRLVWIAGEHLTPCDHCRPLYIQCRSRSVGTYTHARNPRSSTSSSSSFSVVGRRRWLPLFAGNRSAMVGFLGGGGGRLDVSGVVRQCVGVGTRSCGPMCAQQFCPIHTHTSVNVRQRR